jgi:hypothetical protein
MHDMPIAIIDISSLFMFRRISSFRRIDDGMVIEVFLRIFFLIFIFFASLHYEQGESAMRKSSEFRDVLSRKDCFIEFS